MIAMLAHKYLSILSYAVLDIFYNQLVKLLQPEQRGTGCNRMQEKQYQPSCRSKRLLPPEQQPCAAWCVEVLHCNSAT